MTTHRLFHLLLKFYHALYIMHDIFGLYHHISKCKVAYLNFGYLNNFGFFFFLFSINAKIVCTLTSIVIMIKLYSSSQ